MQPLPPQVTTQIPQQPVTVFQGPPGYGQTTYPASQPGQAYPQGQPTAQNTANQYGFEAFQYGPVIPQAPPPPYPTH